MTEKKEVEILWERTMSENVQVRGSRRDDTQIFY